ncbi:MAG: hypothetical protein JNL05_12910 [Flavobacteriales bacterium]|nr:hypothetical protein [Flavobacteriales bacterium]
MKHTSIILALACLFSLGAQASYEPPKYLEKATTTVAPDQVQPQTASTPIVLTAGEQLGDVVVLTTEEAKTYDLHHQGPGTVKAGFDIEFSNLFSSSQECCGGGGWGSLTFTSKLLYASLAAAGLFALWWSVSHYRRTYRAAH